MKKHLLTILSSLALAFSTQAVASPPDTVNATAKWQDTIIVRTYFADIYGDMFQGEKLGADNDNLFQTNVLTPNGENSQYINRLDNGLTLKIDSTTLRKKGSLNFIFNGRTTTDGRSWDKDASKVYHLTVIPSVTQSDTIKETTPTDEAEAIPAISTELILGIVAIVLLLLVIALLSNTMRRFKKIAKNSTPETPQNNTESLQALHTSMTNMSQDLDATNKALKATNERLSSVEKSLADIKGISIILNEIKSTVNGITNITKQAINAPCTNDCNSKTHIPEPKRIKVDYKADKDAFFETKDSTAFEIIDDGSATPKIALIGQYRDEILSVANYYSNVLKIEYTTSPDVAGRPGTVRKEGDHYKIVTPIVVIISSSNR